ncbi:nitrate- and nitrite sensing domain-containing protein (plasmid) [Thioclava sp. 'Guangxiensis']|uniref:methyl-accepting chemotaxis protein n=1 Tax=Thioclava sp. 'Guangxiensis' TaxID=3149044 RepID=UPI0032C47650
MSAPSRPVFLHQKVSRLIMVPLFAVVVFSAAMITQRISNALDAQTLTHLMRFASSLSNLVHEQQKERGATSIYLSSKGATFAEELAAQRALTDERVREVAQVGSAVADGLPPELASSYAEIQAQIAKHDAVRAQVDDLAIPVPDALGHYTKINGDTIAMLGQLTEMGLNADMAKRLSAFTSFMAAKERAGIERAIGSGGFALGRFDTARLGTLHRLISQQDMGFAFFRQFATPEQVAAFATLENGSAFTRVNELRAIAFAYPDTGSVEGITPKEFFDATTTRIGQLKTFEDSLGSNINEVATAYRNHQLWLLLLNTLAMFAATAVILVIARRITRSMVQEVTNISQRAAKMATGDLESDMPMTTIVEFDRINEAIEAFRSSILTARAKEETHAKEELAREHAERERSEVLRLEERRASEQALAETTAKRAADEAIAKDVRDVVNACASGDFTKRIPLEGKDGIMADLCQGLNEIGASVEQGLGEVERSMQTFARGDFTYRMPETLRGSFRRIAQSSNQAAEALSATMQSIAASSQRIESSTREISDASADLARRSEKNAAVLEETTSALTEMSASVSSSSRELDETQKTVTDINERAERGHEVVVDAIAAMSSIENSSAKIERVLQVIDDIAFQTNLLALNAGVEAARAGEAGRGFAVVASEVRALAQRSADASQEIGTMISTSSADVQRGVSMVNSTGRALEEIVQGVRDIRSRIEGIVGATRETTIGIKEISNATLELDQTTQKNAAMFEETNAAITTLRNETQALSAELGTFKIDTGDVELFDEPNRMAS